MYKMYFQAYLINCLKNKKNKIITVKVNDQQKKFNLSSANEAIYET